MVVEFFCCVKGGYFIVVSVDDFVGIECELVVVILCYKWDLYGVCISEWVNLVYCVGIVCLCVVNIDICCYLYVVIWCGENGFCVKCMLCGMFGNGIDNVILNLCDVFVVIG